MDKIANTSELQNELRKLLTYAGTEHPSRIRLANSMRELDRRVAGTPRMFVIRKKGGGFEVVQLSMMSGAGYREVDRRQVYPSLAEARARIPKGLTQIDRDHSDPHDIVETWKEEW